MPRHPCPHPPDPAWPPPRKAHLRRKVWKKMGKFRNSKELQYLVARDAAPAEKMPPCPTADRPEETFRDLEDKLEFGRASLPPALRATASAS